MGWCSATEIMDVAVKAALDLIATHTHQDASAQGDGDGGRRTICDDQRQRLATFVKALASALHDRDWDCVEESDFFDSFPQEMLGMPDDEFLAWKREQLEDWDGGPGTWPSWAGPVPDAVADPQVGP